MIKNKFIGSKGESIFASYTDNGKLEIKINDSKNTAVFEGEGTHKILDELCEFLTDFRAAINKNSQVPTKFSKKFLGLVTDELIGFLSKKLEMSSMDITIEFAKEKNSKLLKTHIINSCASMVGIEPDEVWE